MLATVTVIMELREQKHKMVEVSISQEKIEDTYDEI